MTKVYSSHPSHKTDLCLPRLMPLMYLTHFRPSKMSPKKSVECIFPWFNPATRSPYFSEDILILK